MSETNENIYQIDLDLLKEAETVFRQTAEKMNENMENMKTMVAGTEDIYQGVDAEALRSGVTDFVNTGMTALQEKTAGTARILKEAYTDYGFCKTYCEHFEDVLDGQANGATFGESVSGKMKADLDGIEEIREKCKSVCEETEEIRKGLIVIENMLANLPVGGFDVTPYTQAIREQTYVVDRLDDYRIGLGKYAGMAENANDRTKEKLTALAQEYETIRETHAEIPEKETVDEEIWKQEIENYWNRKDGYFEEGWWLDEEKKQEAINMLLLESALSESGEGEEAGYDLLAHYTGTEIGSPKRYALQIMFQLEPIDGDDGIVLNNIAGACLREGIDLAGNGWIIPQEIMQKHMIEHRKLQVQSDEDEKRLVSFILNFTPVLGEGKAVIEAIVGRDLLTGEELSGIERVIGLAAGFSDVVYYLKGVKGARYTDDVIDAVGDVSKGCLDTIFKSGKVSIDDIIANPKAFSGKTVEEIADVLRNSGYDVTIKKSAKSKSGAQIIKVNNPGGGKNISQVQVSPGGGRHGDLPYVKISTTDQGKIKIIDGPKDLYKTDGEETATIIFSGGK